MKPFTFKSRLLILLLVFIAQCSMFNSLWAQKVVVSSYIVNLYPTVEVYGQWTLYDNGELYIQASKIPDYNGVDEVPWYNYTEQITSVRFGNSGSPLRIGRYSFLYFKNLKKVTFDKRTSADVTIGKKAFYYASNLEDFDFTYVKEIEDEAFISCKKLHTLIMPAVEKIGNTVFSNNEALTFPIRDPDDNFAFPAQLASIFLTGNKVVQGLDEMYKPDGEHRRLNVVIPPSMVSKYENYYGITETNNPYMEFSPLVNQTYLRVYIGGFFNGTSGAYWMAPYIHPSQSVSWARYHPFNDIWAHIYHSTDPDDNTPWYMPDYTNPSQQPWASVRKYIRRLEADIYVKRIGDYAFAGCDNIMYISMGNIEIGSHAFQGCSKIYDATGRFRKIGDYAFDDCSLLSIFNFEYLKEINKWSFSGCTSLSSIQLPEAETIGEGAFSGCTELKDITFGKRLNKIESKAFANTLQSDDNNITVYGSVPYTSSSAFDGAKTGSTMVSVPYVVSNGYLTDNVWKKFNISKTNLKFPVSGTNPRWTLNEEEVLTIEDDVPDYNSIDEQPWASYRERISVVRVADGVTKIGKNAFRKCAYLRSVDMSDNVSVIGQYAFAEDQKLRKVIIPGVKTIGQYAFNGCQEMTEIEMPNVETIDSYAFKGCNTLGVVKFGDRLSNIASYAFDGCTKLSQITNNAATPATASKWAFGNTVSDLKEISLTINEEYLARYLVADVWREFSFSGITTDHGTILASGPFGDGVFVLYSDGTLICSCPPDASGNGYSISGPGDWGKFASSIKTIEVSGGVAMLDGNFRNLPNLTKVTLPASVKYLYSAFTNCPKLSEVNTGNVELLQSDYEYENGGHVGNFQGCTSLTSIDISKVKYIDARTFMNSGIKSINCPVLEGISEEAFKGCKSLREVDAGTANIMNGAFEGCTALETFATDSRNCDIRSETFKDATSLRDLRLGNNIYIIYADAFNGSGLRNIYTTRPCPAFFKDGALNGVNPSSITVYVPQQFVDTYKAADGWKQMKIVEDKSYNHPFLPTGGALTDGSTWSLDTNGKLTFIEVAGETGESNFVTRLWAPYIKEVEVAPSATALNRICYNTSSLDIYGYKYDLVEKVTIGKNVKSLGQRVLFSNNLKHVYCYAPEPPALNADYCFRWAYIESNQTVLHVLKKSGVKAKYEATDWSKFYKIVADLDEQSEYNKGDVNHDDSVNTADVTAIYSYIINGTTSGFTAGDANVNGDNEVNTADVTAVYNIIIGK